MAKRCTGAPVLHVGLTNDSTLLSSLKDSDIKGTSSFLSSFDSFSWVHTSFCLDLSLSKVRLAPIFQLSMSGQSVFCSVLAPVLLWCCVKKCWCTCETVFTDSGNGSPVNGVPVCTVYLISEFVTGYDKLAIGDRMPTLFRSITLAGKWSCRGSDAAMLCGLVLFHKWK